VAAPLFILLALAEGRLDGDAEFFGRQLAIEGDMEAVLALRNAMENETVDFVADLAPSNRLLGGPVSLVLGRVREAALKSGGR
jgi:predicted lipid carrier protein YhbT